MRSEKKIRKGLLGLAILFAMTLQMLLASEVRAAEEYTYTLTFYAGNHGTFADGQDVMKIYRTRVWTESSSGCICRIYSSYDRGWQ